MTGRVFPIDWGAQIVHMLLSLATLSVCRGVFAVLVHIYRSIYTVCVILSTACVLAAKGEMPARPHLALYSATYVLYILYIHMDFHESLVVVRRSTYSQLMGKSPLIWTRFIRDSIVCVNAAIEKPPCWRRCRRPHTPRAALRFPFTFSRKGT